MNVKKLKKARQKIDRVDKGIFKLIRKRSQIVKYMLSLKKHLNVKSKFDFRQEVIQNYLSKNYGNIFLKKNQKIDLIICSKLIEHSQNIKEVFSFFKKILNENGSVIIDVPDYY